MMNAKPWDAAGEARKALHNIVLDPQYGTAALSQPAVMSNLLKDLLPDEPREASLLVAAAHADLAGSLRGYAAQGLDPGTAVSLTANSFVSSTSHTPEACTWVVTALALALGLDPSAARPELVTAPPPPQPGQPTLPAAVNAAFNQPPPPYSPVSPAQPAYAGPGSPWQQSPVPPRPTGPRSPGSVAAGIFCFAGALLVLIACFVPLSKPPGGPNFGVFFGHAGFAKSADFWIAAQPVVVLLIAIAVGIGLVAPGNRPRARAMFQGMLIAIGIQAVLLFGFDGFAIFPSAPRGGGGALGILGGLVLLVGGLIGLARSGGSQPAAATNAATPTGAAT